MHCLCENVVVNVLQCVSVFFSQAPCIINLTIFLYHQWYSTELQDIYFCFQLLTSTTTVIMADISYMTSVNVEIKLNHFNCMICLDILENPVIVNCPCKCIVCEKCISEYWKMQILPKKQSGKECDEVQEVKRCICNCEGILASECREAIGLSRMIKNIE